MVTPPQAKKIEHRATLHGVTRNDPYHWLRDDNWQRVMREPETLEPAIREHLERENAHTEEVLATTAGLQQTLFEELKGRIKEDESSVPAKDGPFDYYVRYELGSQHPRYCRRPTRGKNQGLRSSEPSADEQVLFDADAASKAHAYFSVGSVVHSKSHRLLGHAVDTKGSEYYDIAFRALDTGAALPDLIQSTSGSLVFADDSTIFYTAVDDNHRPSKVYRHRLGTPQADDVLVYEEPDPGFFVGVDATEDEAHIVITSHDHVTSEQRLIPTRRPLDPPRLVAARRPGVEYGVSAFGERLLILTNDGALDFKLVDAPLDDPDPARWRDVVPHRPGCLIVAVTTFAQHVVRLERESGLPRIVVRSRADGKEHVIAFDEQAYSLGLSPGYEFDTTVLRFTYSSLTTPQQTFDYDMVTHERVLVDQREIPSGHEPKRYRTARVMAPSHDGEQVPVSLLWHASTDPANAPLYLYGYGSYGHTVPAGFSSNVLNLVNRGFVYAIAHARGGKDKGYAWYESGKLMHKKNTFFDFVAAAEHLPRSGYGRAGSVTIHGGSAGGMLVGASVNLRPDLFRAVVGEVPFVDVLNTMCDAELPLTPPEWPEWGNPIESAEAYRYIASYSPYDNVEAKAYPHILATAGLTDPRVTYWEPAKWVARLRELGTGDNLLLLRTYMEAGHAGAAGRFEKLHQVALVQAFVLLANDAVDRPVLSAR
ncbi:MAG TPA: S9 family peptidase [Polyangiaceae bacterium]|nr:S9 family peptidase [Polyangiaceae bacterium]